MCVLIFLQFLSETFLILRRIQPDSITNVRKSSCKVPDVFNRLYSNLKLIDEFSKTQYIWKNQRDAAWQYVYLWLQ